MKRVFGEVTAKAKMKINANLVAYVRTANVKNVGQNGSYWDREVNVDYWITH